MDAFPQPQHLVVVEQQAAEEGAGPVEFGFDPFWLGADVAIAEGADFDFGAEFVDLVCGLAVEIGVEGLESGDQDDSFGHGGEGKGGLLTS